jgi:hypothetical protein
MFRVRAIEASACFAFLCRMNCLSTATRVFAHCDSQSQPANEQVRRYCFSLSRLVDLGEDEAAAAS